MKTQASMLLLAFAAGAAPAHAQHDMPGVELQPPVERPVLGNYVGEPGLRPELLTEGFISGHPDLRWRREGLHSYSQKEYDLALVQFERAARYGDKPAQAMLAEMYWKGIGVARDRARGYAWMDIAAERRFPNFVILRERYWSKLDAAKRSEAVRIGQPLMDEFGDEQARLRLAKVMRRDRAVATGSHLGFAGNISGSRPGLFVRDVGRTPSTGPLSGSGIYVAADKYYASENWVVTQYWRRQAEAWGAPMQGHVAVGDLTPVGEGQAGEATEPPADP